MNTNSAFVNKNIEIQIDVKEKAKTIQIQNRRYLGNKYRLLDFIKDVVSDNCKGVNTVADIFAGTGVVASAFTNKSLITNDNLYSNYISHIAWFSPEKYSVQKVESMILNYNKADVLTDNYMSENFADTFFSREDCRKIGFIRENIELNYLEGKINSKERALLITSLLYAADKIANTCGHYDAYRQGVQHTGTLELALPISEKNLSMFNRCYNEDSDELVKQIKADLVYIDPPYNSRQYCDSYHLLENIARWEKPIVHGVARKMNRLNLKSKYCTNKATVAFESLIENINAKYILLSYNNMAKKGNDRSNAKISDEDILSILNAKGDVKVFTHNYKPFTTGKSEISEHEERLFLCIVNNKNKKYIQSPLNYTGGKYKLLPQIMPHFPKNIDTFVDLFCGGSNVGVNIKAHNILLNDKNDKLFGLYSTFLKLGYDKVYTEIESIITKYGLSKSSVHGYEYYNCTSSKGLGSHNTKFFVKLRNDFNKMSISDSNYYIMFYVLIIYAFNNQIRFNSKREYNLPVGKRDFNDKMKAKLSKFIKRLETRNLTLLKNDFREVDLSLLTKDSVVYCDPPYLITCATYNEQGGWGEQDEHDLLNLLDELDQRGIKFVLSNVLSSKGKTNTILIEWLSQRSYRTISIDNNFSNSNYQTKDKDSSTNEVIILNY